VLNFSQFDPAFSHVAEVFEGYIESDQERGALSLRINGRTVLDLCAGQARPEVQMPWSRNTLACCFSVTKGVLALLAHLFIDRNFLDLDAKVCSLWPEFASSGKKI
jgi:CubicO group peptidase (beta-lactamase class C family)